MNAQIYRQSLMLMVGVVLCSPPPTRADSISDGVTRIQKRHQVRVHYDYGSEDFFPEKWRKAPISATGSQLDQAEVRRLIPFIEHFLERYPKSVIKKHLKHIYLLSSLRCYGKRYGGTSSNDAIYITSRGARNGFSREFVLGRMYSEFSSILFRSTAFPEREWKALNPLDFKYVGSGQKMLGQANLYSQSEELLQQGFINRYAQSDVENDFNMMTDWLFTRPRRLRELGQLHPRIKAKTELTIKFYRSLDRDFEFETSSLDDRMLPAEFTASCSRISDVTRTSAARIEHRQVTSPC